MPAFTSGAAALHQLLVELLQVVGSQLRELDAVDAGDGILLDHQVVAIRRGHPRIGLGVDVVPAPQPPPSRWRQTAIDNITGLSDVEH